MVPYPKIATYADAAVLLEDGVIVLALGGSRDLIRVDDAQRAPFGQCLVVNHHIRLWQKRDEAIRDA